MSSQDLRRAALLKIHHLAGIIVIRRSELSADPESELFANEFNQMVSLARSIVNGEKEGNQFSLSSGILAPLYYCGYFWFSHAPIRTSADIGREYVVVNHRSREALKLLAPSRKEGQWDSAALYQAVKRVIEVEEAAVIELRTGESGTTRVYTAEYNRGALATRESADELTEEEWRVAKRHQDLCSTQSIQNKERCDAPPSVMPETIEHILLRSFQRYAA